MEGCVIKQLSSASSAVTSIVYGLLGNRAKYRLFVSKLSIDKNIGFDRDNNEYYILIENHAKSEKWNAYDLNILITYCDVRSRPFHTGEIKDSRLEANAQRRYVISLSNGMFKDVKIADFQLNVVLTFRNRRGKLFIIEQNCIFNKSPLIR